MAYLNDTPLSGIAALPASELARKLIAASPARDGRGVRLVLSLDEESDLFLQYEHLALWLTRIVRDELTGQGRTDPDLVFEDLGGGIFVSGPRKTA